MADFIHANQCTECLRKHVKRWVYIYITGFKKDVALTTMYCLWPSGLLSHDVGNPYIVHGISVNKLITDREQREDKPDIANFKSLFNAMMDMELGSRKRVTEQYIKVSLLNLYSILKLSLHLMDNDYGIFQSNATCVAIETADLNYLSNNQDPK